MYKFTLAAFTAAAIAAAPVHAADLWDVYQLALQNDPTFQQAQATYEAAQENAPIARAGYLPNLGLSANRTLQRSNGSQPFGFGPSGPIQGQFDANNYSSTYTLQLTQPIFNWSAWENIKQADASVAQAEAQYLAAQQALIVRTATAYFAVLTARDTLAADRAAKQANDKLLEQAKEKYQVGMSAVTDVQEAQAAYDQSVADEIGGQQQVINAEESLRAITGQPVTDLEEPPADMPLRNPVPDDAQKWVSQALQQNPNLLAAQAGAQVAAKAVSIKRAGHYPTLDMTLSHTKNNNSNSFSALGSTFNELSNTNGNLLMLSLNFPIFSGGGVSAQVTQAQRQYDAAQDQVQLVTRQTEQQARTAFLGVLTGISQVQALKQSVTSNDTSLQATEAGMQVGTRTIVDVLTSRQNLLKAQTSFAQSRYNYLTSVLQLKQAAGDLSANDVKQINSMLQVEIGRASWGERV